MFRLHYTSRRDSTVAMFSSMGVASAYNINANCVLLSDWSVILPRPIQ